MYNVMYNTIYNVMYNTIKYNGAATKMSKIAFYSLETSSKLSMDTLTVETICKLQGLFAVEQYISG